jgi:hypothetical protein
VIFTQFAKFIHVKNPSIFYSLLKLASLCFKFDWSPATILTKRHAVFLASSDFFQEDRLVTSKTGHADLLSRLSYITNPLLNYHEDGGKLDNPFS